MKISTKGRYALRAMIEMAQYYAEGEKITLKEIAKGQDLSVKYLAALLVKLHENKLIISYKGKFGGYLLSKSPDQITIAEIFEAVEGPIDLVSCIARPIKCKKSENCKAREIWSTIGNDLKNVFNKYSLNDVI